MSLTTTIRFRGGFVDVVAIQRRLTGDRVTLTDEERVLAVHYADRLGLGVNQIQRTLGISGATLADLRNKPCPVDPARLDGHVAIVNSKIA